MKTVWRIFFLVFIVLFLTSAKNDDNLSKYLEVLEQSKGYRSFSFEDGVPRNGNFILDKDGYVWSYSMYPIIELKRFNGNNWDNMLNYISIAEKEKITGVSFTKQHDVYLTTKHHILFWVGSKFVKYKLPSDAEVIETTTFDNKILVMCSTGYCVLEGDTWKFYPCKVPKSNSSFSLYGRTSGDNMTLQINIANLFLDTNNRLYSAPITATASFLTIDQPSSDNGSLVNGDGKIFLYTYSESRIDSTLIYDNYIFLMNDFLPDDKPENIMPIKQGILIGMPATNSVFFVDPRTKSITKHSLNTGYKIVSMYYNTDKSAINILCAKDKHLIVHSFGKTIGKEDAFLPVDYDVTLPIPLDSYSKVFTYSNGSITSKLNTSQPANKNVLILKDTGDAIIPVTHDLSRNSDSRAKSRFILQFDHKSESALTNISIFDVANESSRSIMLPGNISNATILDEKAGSSFFISEDRLWICPFEANFIKVQGETQGFIKAFDDPHNGLGYVKTENGSRPTISITSQAQNGTLKVTHAFEGFEDIGVDKKNKIVYLKKTEPDSTLLIFHEVETKKTIEIGKIPSSTNISLHDSLLFFQNGTKYSIYQKTKLISDGRFGGFEIATAKYLKGTNITIIELLNNLNAKLISSDIAFSKRMIIPISSTSISDYIQVIKLLKEIRLASKPTKWTHMGTEYLEIPPTVYYLKDNSFVQSQRYTYNIIDIYPSGKDTFVSYVDSTASGFQVGVSIFEKGEILRSKHDISIPLVDSTLPDFNIKQHDGHLYIFTENSLIYRKAGTQYTKDVRISENFGSFKDAVFMGDDVWILYQNGLVKHSLVSGISFPFSAKDGLPSSQIQSIWNFNNTLYFISNKTLYKANNTRSNVRTSIPWIEVRTKRYSTKQASHLKYDQTDVIIPIDILNVLYPEKCILEYRLKGYDDTWRRRPYISQLEYNKLTPGRYEFEVKAYTPDGYVSAMAMAGFQIHPPFWGTWWAYLIYIVVVIYIFRYLYMMRNRQLQLRNSALEQQIFDRTRELQEKQQKMTESIEYASLIQRSMLPPDDVMGQLFHQHFVLWKPRDIVGGDFYWLHHDEETNRILFALIDCTGHGVPGALLSMTVNSLLNKVVKDRGITDPALILHILHKEIGAVLYQDKTDNQQDGFEISLLNLDLNQRIVHFAGAGLGFLLYDSGKLQKIQGERYSIGGLKRRQQLSFTLQSFSYHPYAVLYLYSDGILDQPDPTHPRRKRLGSAALIEFVEQVHNMDLDITKTAIDTKMKEMLQYSEQRDDITVIGIQPG